MHRRTGALNPLQERSAGSEFRWRSHAQAEVKSVSRVHPGREHIGRITAPCDGLALNTAAMLFESHHVSEDLAWMRTARQPINNRHARVQRKLDKRIVIERADHDGIDITRKHPCRVRNGFTSA